MKHRSYRVGASTITIVHGDITASGAEVLVSSDDYWLTMGGGVSWALRKAAGPRIQEETERLVPTKAGEVVVTSAGWLSAKYILHAVTIGPEDTPVPSEVIVRQATRRVMELLPLLRCRSVAFPSLGTGVAGMSRTVVASQMAAILVDFLLGTPEEYRVELWLLDRQDVAHEGSESDFIEAFVSRTLGVIVGLDAGAGQTISAPIMPLAGEGDETEAGRRRAEVFRILQHVDSQRQQVEAQLLSLLEGKPDCGITLSEARGRLEHICGLRRIYEQEIEDIDKKAPIPHEPGSVFLSSTYIDLMPQRRALRGVIEGMGLKFIGMEEFSPTEIAPPELIRKRVRTAEVYMAVIGMRYGSVDPRSKLSMTHLEYNQAAASGKPMRIFVMDDEAMVRVGHVEKDLYGYAKLLEFRSQIMKERTCKPFRSEAELLAAAEKVLTEVAGSAG